MIEVEIIPDNDFMTVFVGELQIPAIARIVRADEKSRRSRDHDLGRALRSHDDAIRVRIALAMHAVQTPN